MTGKSCTAAALVAILLAGCGKQGPLRTGGKPISHWIESLTDADPKVRKTAAFKLGNVNAADPTALPALLQALADPDPIVRREVIIAIVKFGADAQVAIPALTELGHRDPDAIVRDYAGKALDKLDSQRGR
jgi:HEAT repeat protein